MHYYSFNPEADTLSGLTIKVSQITEILHNNVDDVLKRGEDIQRIEERGENLRVRTSEFRQTARSVSRFACLQNTKMCACLIVVIICLFLLVAAITGVLIYVIFFSGLVV